MTRQLDRLGSLARKAAADRVPRDPDAREAQFRAAWGRFAEHPGVARHLGAEPPEVGLALARRGELRYGDGVLEAESLWRILKGGDATTQ